MTGSKVKLGIVVSHPIQYYSPLFRHLAKQVDLVVFYSHNPSGKETGKDGFGIDLKWDIDLLSGYKYVFLRNVSRKPSLSSFYGCDTPGIGKAFRDENVTHVLVFGWYLKSYWQAFRYCLGNNISVAVRGDSQIDPAANPLWRLIKKIIYPFFVKKYDAVLFTGVRNKRYMLTHGARESQLIFSPHAVDQQFWKPGTSKKNSEKIIFVWAAKFIDKKRPTDVIAVFSSVCKKIKNLELHMAGTGPLLDLCKKQSAGNENIHFLGFKNQTELRELFSVASCLVLTSGYGETWGLVVNEAFSMGLPAVVSDACGCAPDLIEEGESGYTYRSGKVADLEDKMIKIINDINSGKDFSKAIYRINAVHSFDAAAAGILQFLSRP